MLAAVEQQTSEAAEVEMVLPDGPDSDSEPEQQPSDVPAPPHDEPAAAVPDEQAQPDPAATTGAEQDSSDTGSDDDDVHYPDTSVAVSYERGSGVRVHTQASSDVSRQTSEASLRSDAQRGAVKGV